MSIMRCDRHGSWDSDEVEECPLCDGIAEEIAFIDEMASNAELIAKTKFGDDKKGWLDDARMHRRVSASLNNMKLAYEARTIEADELRNNAEHNGEKCFYCGQWYPHPIGHHHAEDECEFNKRKMIVKDGEVLTTKAARVGNTIFQAGVAKDLVIERAQEEFEKKGYDGITKEGPRFNLMKAVKPFAKIVSETSGRIPVEKLSLSNWHDLVEAYNIVEDANKDNSLGAVMVTDEMVNRFLNWKLPQDFAPDGGISFEATYPGYLEDGTFVKNVTRSKHEWPIGTNLLTAEQARKMLEYVLAEQK